VASLDDIDLSAFDEICKQCYLNSLEHGFYEDLKYHKDIETVRTYWGNKLMLMVGEYTEAHEELRSGRSIREVYYNPDKPTKPEGVPVEVTDGVIRSMDFLGYLYVVWGVKPSDILLGKFNYNSSRPPLHGRTM
jgi:hypothetical protein